MANRYWVGGTGTWDATDTTHWAATSGGAGGASVPVTTDAVLFDGSVGPSGTVITLGYDPTVLSINFTSFVALNSFDAVGSLYTISLSGTGTVWTVPTAMSLLGTPNITLSNNTTTPRVFQAGAGAKIYGKITIGGSTASSTTSFNNSVGVTFNELASTKTVSHQIIFPIGNQTIINTWSVTGTTGNVVSINSVTAFTACGIRVVNKTTGIDYLNFTDVTSRNTTPVTFWAGANSTNLRTQGIIYAASNTKVVYALTSGTSFSTPADWNSANNSIYLFGGGGGGSGDAVITAARCSGSGGGGGGFTPLSNQTISGAIPYAIGAGGTAGTGSTTTSTAGSGGTTTWNTTNTATGGVGGVSTTVSGTGGVGGTGTYTGGTGGNGRSSTGASGGGGGGGAAGLNGNGANGGLGNTATTNILCAGGGGGGNGGGTAGGNGTTAPLSGAGGNNFSGVGGGASVSANAGLTGTQGGGGSGGVGSTGGGGGFGGFGIEILNSFGSGGGAGGGAGIATFGATVTGLYGAGGAGVGCNAANTLFSGAAGAQGAIIIVYVPILTASISENTTLGDTAVAANVFPVTAIESITITATQVRLGDAYAVTIIENSGLNDLKTVSAKFNSALSEAITVIENESSLSILSGICTEDSILVDTPNRNAIFASSITEELSSTDAITVQGIFAGYISENMVMFDQMIGYGWFRVVDSQTVVWSDINNTQSMTWTNIGDNQDPNWVLINNEQP